MGIIPSWIRSLAVFLVVLSTVSPRFFSQIAVADPSSTECKWEECAKEALESDVGSEKQTLHGSAAFGGWCPGNNPSERIAIGYGFSSPWTVLLRELPARAPPSLLS